MNIDDHDESGYEDGSTFDASPAPPAIGVKWLKFWTYFGLPLMFVSDVLLQFSKAIKSDNLHESLALFCTVTIIRIAVIYGMIKRRLFAWWMNMLLITAMVLVFDFQLISETEDTNALLGTTVLHNIIALSLVRTMTFVFVALSVVWLVFNIIYWRRRKHLFSDGTGRMTVPGRILLFLTLASYIVLSIVSTKWHLWHCGPRGQSNVIGGNAVLVLLIAAILLWRKRGWKMFFKLIGCWILLFIFTGIIVAILPPIKYSWHREFTENRNVSVEFPCETESEILTENNDDTVITQHNVQCSLFKDNISLILSYNDIPQEFRSITVDERIESILAFMKQQGFNVLSFKPDIIKGNLVPDSHAFRMIAEKKQDNILTISRILITPTGIHQIIAAASPSFQNHPIIRRFIESFTFHTDDEWLNTIIVPPDN